MCKEVDKTDLVSYLYDDLAAPERATFEAHLRACADCREEVMALRGVRADLLTWAPPEPEFAFRIVADRRDAAGTVLRPNVPSWRAWFTPAAGFAAAAVLVLAAAAGLARVEIHTGSDGFTLRTGAPSAGVAAAAGFLGLRARDVNLALDGADPLAALEKRISALESASHDTTAFRNASSLNARASEDEILKVVRDLLAQSETRQKGELALRIAQVFRDVDAQRVSDLNRMQQGINRIDANVAEETQAHSELMKYILTPNTKTR
jgi:anti-sigma factor RsiW